MKYTSKIYKRFIFTHKFFRYLLIDRIKKKKDNIVLISGKRGSGKTTLSIKAILGFSDMEENEKYYNEEKRGKTPDSEYKKENLKEFTPFDMEKHICFGKKELQTLWKEEHMAFILADEAITAGNRRNSMTRANKILMEIATINRKNFNTIFFCLPSIEDFDLAILQYITHWVHIDDRGLAAVLLPNPPSLFGRKSWDIDKLKKIYEKFIENNPTAASVPYWLFNNFRGYIKFAALPKKIEDKYTKIATMKKNSDTDELEKELNKPKRGHLTEDKQIRIKKIVERMINGEINNSEDYYSSSSGLEMTKDKYNKEINKQLFALGDGRNFSKIISENKNKIKQEEDSENIENLEYMF